MDENNIPNACSAMTSRQMLASRLRDISNHVSVLDRCVLCRAADELNSMDQATPAWVFIMFRLLSMWDGKTIDPKAMDELINAAKNYEQGDANHV